MVIASSQRRQPFRPRVEALEERAVLNNGFLDPSFGVGGKVLTAFSGGDAWAFRSVLQPDGKIVVAGSAPGAGTGRDFTLTRYNVNGSLDTTFGPNHNGKVTTDIAGEDDEPRGGVVQQTDGKLLAVGYAGVGTQNRIALVRYNLDGSLDNGFGQGGKVTTSLGGPNDFGLDVLLQPNGKIGVLGGTAGQVCALLRYNVNGSLDTTFGTEGKAFDEAGLTDIALQADGKIVAAGEDYVGTNLVFMLKRFNANGSVDTSFGNGGKVLTDFMGGYGSFDQVNSLVVQPDGKLLAAGYAELEPATDLALARYNPDGSLDTSFGSGGKVTTDFGGGDNYAHALVLQPALGTDDVKIVAAGSAGVDGQDEFALARYNADGTIDSGFGNSGTITTAFAGGPDFATRVLLQPDGKLVATGTAQVGGSKEFALARYDLSLLQVTPIDPHIMTKPGPISIDPPDPPPLAGTDITSRFHIQLGKLVFDPGTGRARQKVILQNTSGGVLSGPLTVRLDGLDHQARLHRVGRSASRWGRIARNGQSFQLNFPAGSMPPGARLVVTLEFSNPSRHRLHFEPHVLVGQIPVTT
jgi:uncharacterized delta-60 repeat protein